MNNEVHTAVPRVRKRFSFDVASIWVLTVTVALAMVAFSLSSITPFVYTKITILALGGLVALALYILARLTRGNLIIPPITLLGALWIVPIAYGLSTLFSGVNTAQAFFGTELEADTLGFILILAGFATLAALVFRRTSEYRVFFKVGFVIYGIIMVSEIIFLILGHAMPSKLTPTANLVGSFVDLGMFVGLGVSLILIAQRFLKFSPRMRIILWAAAALGLFILALVNSSLIWILVALIAFGLFVEAILRRLSPTSDDSDLEGVEILSAESEPATISEDTRSLAAPLVVLIIALFFLISASTIGSALGTTFGTNTLDVRPSWQSTFDVGSHTYASAPIFGSGPSTFEAQWLRYRNSALNSTVFWNLTFTSGIGLIPTSFVTEGLVGALAWLAFLGLLLFLGLRMLLFRTPTNPYARFVAVASYTGVWYVLVLAIFAVPGPMVLICGFALLGLFVSTMRYSGMRQEWGVVFARNPRVGFLIVFGLTLLLLGVVLAAYVVIERYLADYSYNEAAAALSAGNLTVATTDINRSLTYAISDRSYQLAALDGIAQMNKIAGDTTLTPAEAQQEFQSALSSSVAAATQATKLNPNNYLNWAVLGEVYQTVVPLNISGAYTQARASYQHAISLDPTDPTLSYTLAQLDIAQKDYSDAVSDLTTAINLKPDYTQAIFLLSQLEVQEGNAKDALQAAEAALYFDPNDPTVLFQVGILRSANGDTPGAIQALAQAVQINPQYANARFFLAVMYTIENNNAQALAQLQAVAALSTANAQAVAPDITALEAGKDPFPSSQLGALGIPQPGVTDQSAAASSKATGTTAG